MSTSAHETGDPDQPLPGTENRQTFDLWDEQPVEEDDAVSGAGDGVSPEDAGEHQREQHQPGDGDDDDNKGKRKSAKKAAAKKS